MDKVAEMRAQVRTWQCRICIAAMYHKTVPHHQTKNWKKMFKSTLLHTEEKSLQGHSLPCKPPRHEQDNIIKGTWKPISAFKPHLPEAHIMIVMWTDNLYSSVTNHCTVQSLRINHSTPKWTKPNTTSCNRGCILAQENNAITHWQGPVEKTFQNTAHTHPSITGVILSHDSIPQPTQDIKETSLVIKNSHTHTTWASLKPHKYSKTKDQKHQILGKCWTWTPRPG